ncbi:MAG: flagellin-like hook-associated protein FlgL [Lentisphaeria bacterium]|jgi:flagellin-like hook-associated protein FlgL
MALTVNSNIPSLNAQRQLVASGRDLGTATERLSSGRRINSAADDAAGLTISNRMTSQIKGLNQAVRNAMDGVSMIQVAEGALDESTNILQRIRELGIQSSNGIYSDTDRATLDAEVQQLVTELDRIAETTSFNGQAILSGEQKNVTVQVGAESNQTISFSIPSVATSALGLQSTSGDLIGGQMSIDGNGGLESALDFSALQINGQSLQGFAAGTNLQEVLDAINSDIDGVTAELIVTVTSPAVGDGVLAGSAVVNITGVFLDGTAQAYSISNTSSLEELADAITTKTGGIVSASISQDGTLSLSSEKFSTMTVQDSTQGTATGINSTQIADPDIAEVVEGLTSNWIAQAENLIETYFGIKGDGVDLTLDLDFTDGVGNTAARVTAQVPVLGGLGINLSLEIDMVDFTATGDENGGSPFLYMDRLIAHEMVHAVMFRNMNMLSTDLPEWFKEGAAEFIHGGDERVETDITLGNLDDQTELSAAFTSGKIGGGGITATGYSAGYTAVRMMHDDIIAAGGTGIDEVMAYLAAGDDISTALANVSSDHGGATIWNSLASFETDFDTSGYTYMITQLTFEGGVGTETDTGAIHGGDYFATDLNAEDVINNSAIGGAQDFNLIIPTEYSGGLVTADAQLVLTSNNSAAITVTEGAAGTDADLVLFGFNSIPTAGEVLGGALNNTAQNTALNVGDLVINDVNIDPVVANLGLFAKVAVINAVSEETGVTASVVGQQSFKMADTHSTEYQTLAGGLSIVNNGLLGINSIGMTVNPGDTAIDIAATINNATAAHGATAYADDQGRLHIESDTVINLGDSVGNALLAELNFVIAGPLGTGSIEINNTQISFNDINDNTAIVDDINAQAGVTGVIAKLDDSGRLQFTGSSAINISLGDTNGLQTLRRLGIDFGFDGNESLTDSNADDRLGDEVFRIDARIQLNSRNDTPISINVTASGATATGFINLNETIEGLSGGSLANIQIRTQGGAQSAIKVVDSALTKINEVRSELGAINNRLDFTINNLNAISEKTSAARSRILDADFAMESASLSRAQIIQQASQAMLAQANQRPQQVLSLLQ